MFRERKNGAELRKLFGYGSFSWVVKKGSLSCVLSILNIKCKKNLPVYTTVYGWPCRTSKTHWLW